MSRHESGGAGGAPSGNRTTGLALAVLHQVARLPVAAMSSYGDPLADTVNLRPAVDVVRRILRQDASLYAWVARETLVLLNAAIGSMPEPWDSGFDTAMAAAGLTPGPGLRPDLERDLPRQVRERALALADWVIGVFFAIGEHGPRADVDPRYTRLFESTDPATPQIAHAVSAWTAVVVARLRATGRVAIPAAPPHRGVAPLLEAGWFPDPVGPAAVGSPRPPVQRWWDGQDWSDRIRLAQGSGWRELRSPLRTTPNR